MSGILSSLGVIAALIAGVAIIGFVILKFYKLASKERAFVRTGAGGQKAVMNGGAFVLPGIHEFIEVNMNTLRLEVVKEKDESLITLDRLRVDMKADFYVRVKADAESVAAAAQTLGQLTLNPEALRNQVESKFVDALRSVTARMPMYELHEKRAEFVQAVQQVVAEDIAKNGLELESVSLTSLNQTKKEYFDPNNAFDAEGLARLTTEIEARRKAINETEQNTAVAIDRKNLETTQLQLSIEQDRQKATLDSAREIAAMTAAQQAEVAQKQAEGRRQAEQAEIEANRSIEQSRVEADRKIKEAKVTAETALQIAAQQQNIDVSNKARDEAAAQAVADTARAEAVKAAEKVATARSVEVAERAKAVTLVQAEEAARRDATGIIVSAEADKQAAENRAAAARVSAEGDRDAAVLRAQATKAAGEAEADALTKKHVAQNVLSAEQIALTIKTELLRVLPAIIAASVKPLESIDSIRIADIGGLNGAAYAGAANGTAVAAGVNGTNGGGLSDQVVNSALRFRSHAPMVDALLGEVGLKGAGNMSALLGSMAGLAGIGAGGLELSNAAAVSAPPKLNGTTVQHADGATVTSMG